MPRDRPERRREPDDADAADARDRAAAERDTVADDRDRTAAQRSIRAAIRDELDDSDPERHNFDARTDARLDREASQGDRRSSAADRRASADDRNR